MYTVIKCKKQTEFPAWNFIFDGILHKWLCFFLGIAIIYVHLDFMLHLMLIANLSSVP